MFSSSDPPDGIVFLNLRVFRLAPHNLTESAGRAFLAHSARLLNPRLRRSPQTPSPFRGLTGLTPSKSSFKSQGCPGAGTTHFRRSEGKTTREAKPHLCVSLILQKSARRCSSSRSRARCCRCHKRGRRCRRRCSGFRSGATTRQGHQRMHDQSLYNYYA